MKKTNILQSPKLSTTLIGYADEKQIEAWEKEYPLGFYYLRSGNHVAYFQNPNLDHVNCAMTVMSATAATAMYEEFGHLTKIGGSDEVLTNPTKLLGILDHLKAKMEGEQAELGNF